MSTQLSTYELLWRCKNWIQKDLTKQYLDKLIQAAIITASREIGDLGGTKPLAWYRETYDEIFTRYNAAISNITQADPVIITADSLDPDLTSDHGFQSDDFVYIAGNYGMERLNNRLFRCTRESATTLSLQVLDDQDDIDTSGYEEYNSGGTVSHAGIVLPKTTIEAAENWTLKRVWNVTFDGYPAAPITEERVIEDHWRDAGGRPIKWRYQKYTNSTFEATNIEHWLFWHGLAGQRYNVGVKFEKSYPDISTFSRTSKTYPPHPIEIHDFIWHRALANLATQAERQRRQTLTRDGLVGDNTKIEIVDANRWLMTKAQDEIAIMNHNNALLGVIPQPSGGMSA